MKKNILAVVILAATLINLTLTAVLLFVFMPNVKKTNGLITKVAQIINLELEDTSIKEEGGIKLDDIEVYKLSEDLTTNLSKGTSGKAHMAKISVSLSLNKKDKDFTKIKELLEKNEDKVKEVVIDEVSKLTEDNFLQSKDSVKVIVLQNLQEKFKSECITGVTFSVWLTVAQ